MRPIQFFLVQRGLIGKIDHGYELTGKISSVAVAKRNGWTFGKTSRQALRDINAIAAAQGWEVLWSAKHGDESKMPLSIVIGE